MPVTKTKRTALTGSQGTVTEQHQAAAKLAVRILAYDQLYPGDDDAGMEVPGEVWQQWLKLARQAAPALRK
jgi:hypothetical protein